jgi:CheY-like chemotaxis protein
MRRVFVVVDDNQLEGDGTGAQLKRIDPACEVLRAGSGEAALALLEERRVVPSLIFLDYQMAGMNGIDTLLELRRMRWLERVPVAMVTEPIADRLVVNSYRLGACAFLTKPVPNFELREVVRDHCQEARQMAAATMVPATVASSSAKAA